MYFNQKEIQYRKRKSTYKIIGRAGAAEVRGLTLDY